MVYSIKTCKRCLMDSTDPDIKFFGESGCSHCIEYLDQYKKNIIENKNNHKTILNGIVNDIKKIQRKNKYDCIVGISGGIDSAMVAINAKKLGLRILGVHVDNGWNSEIANFNIKKLVTSLDIDLETIVINWHSFREIQKAFLYSSTSDIDLPTDHVIRISLNRVAKKNNIKFILNGRNFSTEGILPFSWSYSCLDSSYIKDVCKKYGVKSFRGVPIGSLLELIYDNLIYKISNISILNYCDYSKEKSIQILKEKYDWVDYGSKHYESRYTKFMQGYILPEKFGIDKRKAHLSVLLLNKQISKSMAQKEISKLPLSDEEVLQEKKYLCKKLGLRHSQFDEIMSQKPKKYNDYRNMEFIFKPSKKGFIRVIKILKRFNLVPRSFAKYLTS